MEWASRRSFERTSCTCQHPTLVSLVASCLAFVVQGTAAQSVIPPLPTTGPYPVACTNVEQDLSRVPQGETASQYWRGVASGDTVRYVDALLVSPGNALASTFTAPGDGELYDRWAGQPVSYVYLACYPTTAANSRADYTLPGDVVVPRMQRGGEAPILPSSPSRLPVLLYSHGYGGSPLDGNYLSALVAFASWGYVTLAPFHGDLRYSVFGPDAFSLRFSIPVWDEFVAMQAIRPLSASAGLDVLLARAEWRDRVDTGRIGAFGISQGGETIALLAGAELTYALFQLRQQAGDAGFARARRRRLHPVLRALQPARIRAGPGGSAQGLTMPFLALSGTDDSIAPQAMVRQAIDRMAGSRGHVLFSGQGHNLDPSSGADILTWALGFLDAWLNGNAAANSKLTQVVSVEGGLDDRKEVYVDPDGWRRRRLGRGRRHDRVLQHESRPLLHHGVSRRGGGPGRRWAGAGLDSAPAYAFRSWKAGTGSGQRRMPVLRHRGPRSQFALLHDQRAGMREGAKATRTGPSRRSRSARWSRCPPAVPPSTRRSCGSTTTAWVGRRTTATWPTRPEIDRTVAKGWLVEGPVFCVPR